MQEILLRFFIGGVVVSLFAAVGDVLKPKSFAGLFGAAPSVALATVGLTLVKDGRMYAATEARSMVGGSIAFLVYASVASWVMMRYKMPALRATLVLMPVWFAVAFCLWAFWLG